MEKTLLSKKSLAERWDMSPKTVERYEREGIIKSIPGLPSIRYSLDEILRIESNGSINPLSPLERKRMEKEIRDLIKERDFYKNQVINIKSLLG